MTMKYYVFDPIGDISNLVQRTGRIPSPHKDNDVIIRVEATSLNYKDLVLAHGHLALNNNSAEYVPLSDGAGRVVATGASAKYLSVGERVVASFFPTWENGLPTGNEKALGRELSGMLSEYIRLPAEALVSVPRTFNSAQAAAFPCAGVTAWNALVEMGQFNAGHTVLTMGTGGVSIFALQIAKASGATVIALTGSATKEAFLHHLGADHVINYRQNTDWDEKVLQLTHGSGADIILEVGGAKTFQKSLNAAAFGGRISAVGVLAGVDGMANPTDIIFKSLTINGVYVGNTRMLTDVLNFFEKNKLQPIIDSHSFNFETVPQAYAHMQTQEHIGKIIIDLT
ncbi:Alcohol dehydrogenase [Pseudovibrio axinellae]|uniref:Alcohol dehydrogenase n=1 Tax=Pseudovibrio axinellae TaxID=989403 RepID=A0A166AJL0_9HYPH|nr:NAD(P)-dependent alcohol dehydrogenase [Pseudovibrio axinellae]KZL21198.1 Alcohol dehydrogenase [Pseudovibrio axinellae]SEQ91649.1 NADPH:quinone reductase [Pseudovibrio axinellae]